MKKTKNVYESSEILRKAFWEHKLKDKLSLRKWSELCGIDSSTLTLIIQSKRLIPQKHLNRISQSLNFDLLKMNQFENAYRNDVLKKKGIDHDLSDILSPLSDNDEILEVIEGDAVLLKKWFYIALLEYTLCKSFKEDLDYLSKKFLIPKNDIQVALKELENEKYLVRKNGVLKKQNKKMRIPTTRSRQLIRNFHIQMLDRAKHELQTKTDKSYFEQRLMTGYTVSVNSKKIPKAKLILEKALIEASTVLSDGPADEVFQLQLQLFPLSV